MPEVQIGRVPFKEAIEHFKNKKLVTTKRWDDLIRGEHGKAFTVAGVTKVEMLNDFKKSLDDIRARGGTLQDFNKEFDTIVARYGWKYHGDRSARAKLIFQTNMRTSNAAGRWQKIQVRQAALKKREPDATLYMEYRVLDHNLARRREQHQSWDTIILPVDHPWWDTHYPPNGYNCACSIRVRTQRDLDSKKLKVTENPPALNLSERINRGTGEIYPPTPDGIDVGFDHHHGKSAFFPSGANIVDSRIGKKLSEIIVDSTDFERFVLGELDAVSTVGFLPEGLPELIGAKTSRVFLSSDTIKKQLRVHPEIKVADYRSLPGVFANGLIIKDGVNTFVFVHVGNTIYRAAVKSTGEGHELYVTSLFKTTQKELNRMRKRGVIIREQL